MMSCWENAASSTHTCKHTQAGSRGAGVGVVLGGDEPCQSGTKTVKSPVRSCQCHNQMYRVRSISYTELAISLAYLLSVLWSQAMAAR